MAAKFTVDGDAIRQLAKILVDTKLTEIEYEDDGRRIRVSRGGNIQTATVVAPSHTVAVAEPVAEPVSAPTAAPAAVVPNDHPGTVKSPMVGTAYMSAEPGAAAFVKVGDAVSVGQTLMIIEAMKVMNPIKSPSAGKVLKIFTQDASPVEYGEPLMIIE
jgi:acetyl-CoA carboxylase biotin carboxyl carrier protein